MKKKFFALSLCFFMIFSFCLTSQAELVWSLATDTSDNPIDEMKNGLWRCWGQDYPNLVGDAQAVNQIMSKHKTRLDLMFYNMNLPAEYTMTEVYRTSNGNVQIFLTDKNNDIYHVQVNDSGILDYYNASKVIPPTDSYKKLYPDKKWEWSNITGYLVGTASLAENKSVPGTAFLPLANIQLTTEVKVGEQLTDCQNIIAGPEDNTLYSFANFWYNGALNGEWRNSVLNAIADCTMPGDAVAVQRVTDLQSINNVGLMIQYVRWDGRLCQSYLIKIDKDYDNTERWKQRFSDSQIITKPYSFVGAAEFTDWSYLLPKGSYRPENGIVAYPRIDLDFRKNGDSK